MRSFLVFAVWAVSQARAHRSHHAAVARRATEPANGFLKLEGRLPLGIFPDDTSGNGDLQLTSELDLFAGFRFATTGRYTQIQPGKPYDGQQLYGLMGDIVASRAVFEPSVMPYTFEGLTTADNHNAVNVCNVMRNFTDHGVQVRMRFAHEMNYYQNDAAYNGKGTNTYPGGPADIVEAWKVLHTACKKIAPKVDFFWSPNYTKNLTQLDPYWPGKQYVDVVGLDWYPNNSSLIKKYKSTIGPFYKKYATKNNLPYMQGETGLHYNAPIADKLTWLSSIVNAASEWPLLKSVTWFNFINNYGDVSSYNDFRIIDPLRPEISGPFLTYAKTGRLPPGAVDV